MTEIILKTTTTTTTLACSCLIVSAQQLLHDITYAGIHTYCTPYACRVC